jgi:hypothetical protein
MYDASLKRNVVARSGSKIWHSSSKILVEIGDERLLQTDEELLQTDEQLLQIDEELLQILFWILRK